MGCCRSPPADPVKEPGAVPRNLLDLTTEEAYRLAAQLGHDLPPLDAVENEDWGRDYVLQCLQQHSDEELARRGLARIQEK
jgi:hypothetical protein